MQKAGHRDPSTTKLYDRRGYNPEKAASRFATYLSVSIRTGLTEQKSRMFSKLCFWCVIDDF